MQPTRPAQPTVGASRDESLEQRLLTARLSEAEVLEAAEVALQALAADHAQRPPRLHRALSPAHFVRGPAGALRLLASSETSAEGRGYVAPERLGGVEDPRSDLHALGATLVQLLTGASPAEPLASRASLQRALGPLVSPRARRFLQRLAAVRIEDRFDSAGEALEAVRALRAPPRRRAWVGVAVSALLAGAAGAGFWISGRSKAPEPVTAVPVAVAPPRVALGVEEAVKAPAVAAPATFDDLPPAGEVSFPWQLAQWGRGTSGPWLLDSTGHGHHARLSGPGCATNTFLKCTGTAEARVADGPGFVINGPFSISAQLMLPTEPLTRTAELIARASPDGRFAWSLEVNPDYQLVFKVSDGKGRTSTVTGQLDRPNPQSNGSFSVYAMFDPDSGEQWLRLSCKVLGRTSTEVRPAKELKNGEVRLLRGFTGTLLDLIVQRGLWVPSAGGPKNCSLSLSRMEER